MKKSTGIFLIILGAVAFLFSSFVVLNNTMLLEKATQISEITGDQSHEKRIRDSRAAAVVIFFISNLVIIAGYRMKKKAVAPAVA